MAGSAEEAIREHVKAIGDRKEIKLADTIHLPFQHYSANAEWVFQWDSPEDVPEYMELLDPRWSGTYCRLNSAEILAASEKKVVFRVNVTRYKAEASPLQTFEALYTVLQKHGDWRVVHRNPIKVLSA